jgi:hypothetical protein
MASQAQGAISNTCSVLGGNTVAGLDNIEVECFVTTDVMQGITGYQIDLPCSTGFLLNGNVDVNQIDPTAPYIMSGAFGVVVALPGTNEAQCIALGAPLVGTCTLGGANPSTAYIGTITYDVAECGAGSSFVGAEGHSDPPVDTDSTKYRFAPGNAGLLLPNVTPLEVIVPTGSCCDAAGNCITDGLGEVCCLNTIGGADKWNEGRLCSDASPCACEQNADCDDLNPCNGVETCDIPNGVCVPGTPLVCPACQVCVDGVGCNAAAANGNACGDQANTECDNPNTCLNGACANNFEPAGFACGSNSSGDCDAADTCNGSGVCNPNQTPNGGACPDDGNDCTDDECQGGVCTHPDLSAGTGCDDGLVCTDADQCDGAGGCAGDDATAPGGSCDDGLACTIDSCSEMGGCANQDINGLPCVDNSECFGAVPGCEDTNADTIPDTCACSECAEVELVVTKADDGTNCHDAGEMVFIDVEFGGTAPSAIIGGGSFRITYDNTCLDFVSLSASPSFACDVVGDCPAGYTACTIPAGEVTGICTPLEPWQNIIFQDVDEANGVIFVAVGVPLNLANADVKGTNLAGTMASLKFNKIGSCNECEACLSTLNPQHTRLTDIKGEEIEVCALDCTKTIYDEGETTLNCPGDSAVNADCDAATADVTWPAVNASDTCEGTLDVSCTCTHEPPHVCSLGGAKCNALEIATNSCGAMGLGVCNPLFTPIDCDGLANGGGTFPQGRFFFECGIDDEDAICADTGTCEWTVSVSDQTTLDVVVQLSPNTVGTAFTRCICFELYSSCSPEKFEEVCETMEFGPPWNFPGHAADDVKVPKGANYECITARDRQHSLRATSSIECDGTSYVAEFKGDPFFGGNWLIQGDLNRDALIDILDFGVFLGQLNQNPNPGPKTCEDNNGLGNTHGDINGDGVIDVADFTFIQINFLDNDKNSCCPDEGAGNVVAGRSSITVKELRQLGMDDLAVADLNNDGVVDTTDMSAYLEGARPKDGKIRNGAVRPSRARK